MARTLILVAGYAGSGKTFVGKNLARQLPAFYLDKDTVSGPLVERLLAELHQPAGDRDGSVYREEIRPLEYQALIAAGMEAAELGADVVLSAPFLVQLTDRQWTDQIVAHCRSRELHIRILWVACNPATQHRRMLERGSPRDLRKLAEWSRYAARLDIHLDAQFTLPTRRFDNSESSDFNAETVKLLAWLRGGEPSATVPFDGTRQIV
ncbi:MAG TPA: AAA family ATPase [Lacipirellulaceae bacterium]|nr:AAA family ATPase [Lacipirellulaceae bacterium]HMP07416.1 AAA family ATPase [Lacipirellulaceae bacterium]